MIYESFMPNSALGKVKGLCTVVSPIASQQEGHELKSTSQLGPFCVEFACSLHACVGSFPLPFDLCVSVSPERCLWQTEYLSRVHPASHPMAAGTGSSWSDLNLEPAK